MHISQLLSVLLLVSMAHTQPMLNRLNTIALRSHARASRHIQQIRYRSDNGDKDLADSFSRDMDDKFSPKKSLSDIVRRNEKIQLREHNITQIESTKYEDLIVPFMLHQLDVYMMVSKENAQKLLNLAIQIEECKRHGPLTHGPLTYEVQDAYNKAEQKIADSNDDLLFLLFAAALGGPLTVTLGLSALVLVSFLDAEQEAMLNKPIDPVVIEELKEIAYAEGVQALINDKEEK